MSYFTSKELEGLIQPGTTFTIGSSTDKVPCSYIKAEVETGSSDLERIDRISYASHLSSIQIKKGTRVMVEGTDKEVISFSNLNGITVLNLK